MIFKQKPYNTISLATGIIVKHFANGTIDVSNSKSEDDFNGSDCCGSHRWQGTTDICNECMEHASWE